MGRHLDSKEKKFIERNYQEMTYREIAERLGRHIGTVQGYVWRNGWKKYKPVISSETQFIIDNHANMTSKELSEKTGRPRSTVQACLNHYGLKAKTSEYNACKFTDEIGEYILAHHKEESTRQLAKHCGVSQYTMLRYLKKLEVAPRKTGRVENRYNKLEKDKLLKCLRDWGLTFQDIGDILGVTRQRVQQIFQRFGVEAFDESENG